MNKILDIAFSQYGVSEIPGYANNPIITNYFKEIGSKLSEKYAWCSCFINWCALKSGLERSEKLHARSWLAIGNIVYTPEIGDIVIFWRESLESWKGHVGLYINQDDKYTYVLGGNQNNRVCIKAYKNERVLGYRKLREVKNEKIT